MSLQLDSDFVEAKNQDQIKPIFLYTITDYDGGGTDLRLAGYDVNVTYDGLEYQAFPIEHERIGQNSNGEVDSCRVKLANVNRLLSFYTEQYEFYLKKVTIKTVFADLLSDASAYRDDIYYILSYAVSESVAEFELTSRFNVLQVQLPGRVYLRNHCKWDFKSARCGYSGPETECSKTLTQCRIYANELRYGGFPSIPLKRLYV